MVNLIGDLWAAGPPRWQRVLAHPGARLHLYGKDAPAPGRKMGHVVLLDDDTDRALADADALIARALTRAPRDKFARREWRPWSIRTRTGKTTRSRWAPSR